MSQELLQEFQTFKTNIEGQVTGAVRSIDQLKALMNGAGGGGGGVIEAKSLAESVFEKPEFEAFRKSGGRGRVSMAFGAPEVKTLTNASLGTLQDGANPEIHGPGVRRVRIASLLQAIDVQTGNNVPWIRESGTTNAAYPQTEASTKGNSAMTLAVVNAPLCTIAHYIKASNQLLEDLPMARAYIDQRMSNLLLDAEDFELLRGDGTGSHMTGLMVSATAFDTTKHNSNGITTDIAFDTLSEAFEQIEDANFSVSGIVLNPIDWRQMTRLKDSQSRYILGGPGAMGQPSLWGVPIAVTNAMPRSRFLVGDFQKAAALWRRMQVIIDISTENEDDFIRNMISIRAELREIVTVYRSDGLVTGYLDGVAHV